MCWLSTQLRFLRRPKLCEILLKVSAINCPDHRSQWKAKGKWTLQSLQIVSLLSLSVKMIKHLWLWQYWKCIWSAILVPIAEFGRLPRARPNDARIGKKRKKSRLDCFQFCQNVCTKMWAVLMESYISKCLLAGICNVWWKLPFQIFSRKENWRECVCKYTKNDNWYMTTAQGDFLRYIWKE